MNYDEKIFDEYGVTRQQIEDIAAEYESGDLSNMKFTEPIYGRPKAAMKTSSVKFYEFELAAIDQAASEEGISRSEFIRRACDNELLSRTA